jgi:hypothetical protein
MATTSQLEEIMKLLSEGYEVLNPVTGLPPDPRQPQASGGSTYLRKGGRWREVTGDGEVKVYAPPSVGWPLPRPTR